MAFPTAVNSQITDAVTEAVPDAVPDNIEPPVPTADSQAADAAPEPDAEDPAAEDPVAGEPEPGDTVVQAVLLSIGTAPAKAVGQALGAMAQAAGVQMANAVASYQSWTGVQHAILSQSAAEIFATYPAPPPRGGKLQGA